MRDRLIKLILNTPVLKFPSGSRAQGKTYQTAQNVADHLLANGVVIPPVSVGQTVWVYNQTTNNIYRNTVIGIKIFGTGKNANKIIVKYVNQRGETSDRKFAWAQIGKQVFLSEEEAVQALAERSGNESKVKNNL